MAARLFLTGFVCLCIGVGIGYFVGKQSAGGGASTGPVPFQGQQAQSPAVAAQTEAGLRAALLTNPKDLNALIELGNFYYDQGQFAQAVEWYGKALEIDPKNANVRTDRGTSYWNIGQPDQAIAEFKKSLQVDPEHQQTLYNLGVVYLHGKNDAAEARKAWERLLKVNPNYPNRADIERQLASMATTPSAGPPIGQKAGGPGGKK